MKIWIIALVLVIGTLAFTGVILAEASKEAPADADTPAGCGSCSGDCSSLGKCASSSCNINSGGSCGCKK